MKRVFLFSCIAVVFMSGSAFADGGVHALGNSEEGGAQGVAALDTASGASGTESANPGASSVAEAPVESKNVYEDPSLKPRDIYNLAVNFLKKKEFDSAIEGFGRARDMASFDNELRYSSAYNMGYAYAEKASSLGDIGSLNEESLQSVIDNMSLSVAWFRDAVRQRPSLDEARGNLEIALKRHLAAQDMMAQKYHTPERQLEALIESERGIRESGRVLSQKIESENAQRNPIVFQEDFKSMARAQRAALTEANLVSENISNAKALIESKTEEARTQEETLRKYQYDAVAPLLDEARRYMAGARRQMRDLSMSDALRQTNKAFNLLKQAREQLDDPLRILGHIAEDEQNFNRLAEAKVVFETPELLVKYREKTQNADASLPSWLNNDLLTDNQTDVLTRTQRLSAFLEAVASSAEEQPSGGGQAKDVAAREQSEQIKEALPLIREAETLMMRANRAISEDDVSSALNHGLAASQQLALAMERFADLKHLIEIAYRTQQGVSAIVNGTLGGETPEYMTRVQQREAILPNLQTNIERSARLSNLLAKEAAKRSAEATKAAQQNSGDSQAQEEADKMAAQMQQLFEEAERLRSESSAAMERMVAVAQGLDVSDPNNQVVPSDASGAVWEAMSEDDKAAQANLEQLRMLFFTIVEHVEELLRQQTATWDETTDVSLAPSEEQAAKLPPVIDRQRMHELTAVQLSRALSEQSEKMQAQASQGGGQGGAPSAGQSMGEMAQRYRQAASELDVAATSMRQAQTDLQNASRLFSEALTQQKEATEHIENALELLKPPQQQNPENASQQQQQQNQAQQQEQAQQQQKPQKMSKEQAEKKIQQIRSRDQERRKSRAQDGAGMPVVEKDW